MKSQLKKSNNLKIYRSPLYYLGDKYSLMQQILLYFPDKIDTFYDVFGGGGTMLVNIAAKEYKYNDIDQNLKNLLEFIYKTDEANLINWLDQEIEKFNFIDYLQNNKEEFKNSYLNLRNQFNLLINKNSDIGNIWLLILIIHSFNSQIRFNSKKLFNVPVGKQTLNENRRKVLIEFKKELDKRKIEFSSNDFNYIYELLNNDQFNKNDFFYFDPPYLITNATYNAIWNNQKDAELFDLLDVLSKHNIKWAMSNVFESKGIQNISLINWSTKYNVYYLNKNYQNSNYQRKHKKSKDIEVLITNYEIK
ncbi:DNA adenine methylase [Mycoplasma sp. VS276A1]